MRRIVSKEINTLCLLLLIFFSKSVLSQNSIKETIQLTNTDTYYLDLTKYYTGIIQDVTLSNPSANAQLIPPFQATSTSTTAMAMSSVLPVSFPVNGFQKNIVTILSVPNGKKLFDYYLVFGTVQAQNEAILSYEYARVLLVESSNELTLISLSLYSPTSGFAFLRSGNQQFSQYYQFTYDPESSKISFQMITTLYQYKMVQPKAFQINGSIFMWTLGNQMVSVLNFNQNALWIQDQLTSMCSASYAFQENNYIPNFYIVQQCNDVVSFVSFQSSTMKHYQQDVTIKGSSSYTQAFSQSIYKQIYLMYVSQSQVMVCSFSYSNQYLGVSQNPSCVTIQASQNFSNAVMISQSLVALSNTSQIALYDITKNKMISLQNAPNNQQYGFYNFLNNQVLININQLSNGQYQFYQVQSIQLSSPSIVIQGQIQTINFSLTTQGDFPLSYSGTITVNAVAQPANYFLTETVDANQEVQSMSFNNQQLFTFPIESYVTGNNLSLNFSPIPSSKQYVNSIKIRQLGSTQTEFTTATESAYQVFSLQSGQFSALISQTLVDRTILKYVQIDPQTNLSKVQSTVSINIDSLIDIIDGQGSFTVQSDSTLVTKRIFLPTFDSKGNLIQNQLSIECDSSKNTFAFASDISYNTILVLCGSTVQQIQYQPTNASPYSATIVNSNSISYDFSSCNKISVFNGVALVYGSSIIVAYDYVDSFKIGVAITVSNNPNQKLTVFRNSFFVYYTDGSNQPQIQQYSYGNFQTSSPILLRNVPINSQMMPDLNAQQILMVGQQSNSREYLLIQVKGNTQQYLVYRVNDCTSLNQLFTTLTVPTGGINFFTSNSQCQVLNRQLNCQVILKSAEVSLMLNIPDSQYQQNIFTPISFTGQFPNTPSGSITLQKYTLSLRRNTGVIYGYVNQTAQSISMLKTTVQDTSNVNQNTIFAFQDGSDPNLINSSLLGWQLNTVYGKVTNRLVADPQQQLDSQVFPLMYGQVSLTVSSTSFSINNVQISNDVTLMLCVGLEDTSQTKDDSTQSTFSIYFLCSSSIINYQIKLTKNFGEYVSASLTTQPITYALSQGIVPFIYRRLFSSSDNVIRLFSTSKQPSSQLILDKTNLVAQINVLYDSVISQNMIQSLGSTILVFSNEGTIIATKYNNDSTQTNQVYSLRQLLEATQFGYIAQENSTIQVQQVADNTFNIKYQKSYIYQVSFELSAQSQQLTVSSIQSFDYVDAFDNMLGYFQQDSQTIFIGQKKENEMIVTLYQNKRVIQQCNLINESISKQFESSIVLVNMVQMVGDNQIDIYLSSQKMVTIYINSSTTFTLGTLSSDTKSFTIFPLLAVANQNFITIPLSSGISPTPTSSSFGNPKLNSAFLIIKLILIALMI